MNLAPHQTEALKNLSTGKILTGDTGSGKTRVALAYYMDNEAPRDIVVITTAKKRDHLDWEEEASGFRVWREGSIEAGNLRVDSWNNIKKYEEERGVFFIFDEQRLVGSGAWVKSFLKIAKHNPWIMLSATPGDTWVDYIPVFIANGFYKNQTEFKRAHCVTSFWGGYEKIDRYVGVSTLVRHRNDILVEMPYERHTTRQVHIVEVEHDKELFKKVVKDRWHVYENRPIRDAAELFSVMRKVVNSDSGRLKAVRGLLESHPKLIVFYNFDYELDLLRQLRSMPELSTGLSKRCSNDGTTSSLCEKTGFAIAEWNGHKHEPIPSTESWVYLVQYAAGAEGWNCVDTDAMVFYSLTYSYRLFHQAHGRIDRMNTPFDVLHYYILRSNAVIDFWVWKALQAKKSFNERKMDDQLSSLRSTL